jgi:SH3 domain
MATAMQPALVSPTSTTITTATASTAPAASRPRNTSVSAPPLIVRALYDYHSSDSTNLSFQAGTLIRVLTQLQSGWWDGCIDGERGWFPCNFVTEVDGDELAEEEDFLDVADSSSTSGDEDIGEAALANSAVEQDITQIMSEEFTWVPQADKEGRTFFLNTTDGSTSWELPSTRVYMDDWEEPRTSDEEAAQRSSIDSENSEDILMLGPIQHQDLIIPDFNVPSLPPEILTIAPINSVIFIKTFFPYKIQFRWICKTSLRHSLIPRSTGCPNIRYSII